MNRDSQVELIRYSEDCLKAGDVTEACIALREASRIAELSDEKANILKKLEAKALAEEAYKLYSDKITGVRDSAVAENARILIVTNIFPPQELGGFGKQVWEFADELRNRGNTVKILTANIPSLHNRDNVKYCHFEHEVNRSLFTYGDWTKTPVQLIENWNDIAKMSAHNYVRTAQVIDEFKPDYCLLGNLDNIGYSMIDYMTARAIPVLHLIGNASPGYTVEMMPLSPLYRQAPCSEWAGENLKANGYACFPYYTIYPGSQLNHHYLHYPPVFDKLRIACACLLMSRKGVHVLVNALVYLKLRGVDFVCEIAGASAETGYREYLEGFIRQQSLENKVRFIGLLNNEGLRALFRRSNVFVFPTTDNEPFGKSSIEAMSAGLLTISSGTGGQIEIFKGHTAGLLFESSNAQDLADKLCYIQDNPDEWKSLARQGQSRAFDFTTEKCVAPIVSIFKEIKSESKLLMSPATLIETKKKRFEQDMQYFNDAISLLGEGAKEASLINIDKISDDPFLPLTGLMKAIYCLKAGNPQKASYYALNGILHKADHWEFYACMGLMNYRKNDAQGAYTCFEIAAFLNKSSKLLFLIMSALLMRHGSGQGAEELRVRAENLSSDERECIYTYHKALMDELKLLLESISNKK